MAIYSIRSSTVSQVVAALLLLTTPYDSLIGSRAIHAAEIPSSDQIQESLKGDWGQIKVNLRYRLEHVEQDGLKATTGDPIRLRLGYLTPKYADFQAFAEFEGNTPVFENDYNDLKNGKTEYAVIADPKDGELNQGWLSS